VIAHSSEEAERAVYMMLKDRAFGDAGDEILIEEFMEGEELSLFVLTDGTSILPMIPAQDHKRLMDGDVGPNTGGMGAYAPVSIATADLVSHAIDRIVEPTLSAMRKNGSAFTGLLYAGLMLTESGPKVVEFNCRFGDPETQPILVRMKSDLVEALEASIDGRTSDGDFRWSPEASVCVVVASGGYPGTFEAGKKIIGMNDAAKVAGVTVFHAATAVRDSTFYTSGGRVLGITARAADLRTAVDRAYEAVSKVGFDGMHYRKDIAARALKA